MTRDQERAKYAYDCVRSIPSGSVRDDYKILVYGLGANIMRSGLAAAMAFMERDKSKDAVRHLMRQLLQAGLPVIQPGGADLPDQIRSLELDDYMLVTREMLKMLLWLKRAVQAEITD